MESAAERKARLKALRQEAAAAEVSEPAVRPAAAAATQPAAPEPPTLKFRNYAPRDEKIEHDKIAPANPEQFAPLLAEDEEDDEEPAAVNGESILVNVAPKKPNWDLRRDVEKKLAKLERRTQRALIQIMQAEQAAKLQAEGGIQD